jgi:hypothetical protein
MKRALHTILGASVAASVIVALGIGAMMVGDRLAEESAPYDPWTAPARIIERPVTDTELVVGLAEVVSDLNREVKAARAETIALRNEAQQIINAMMREIERLRSGTVPIPPDSVPTPCKIPPTETHSV